MRPRLTNTHLPAYMRFQHGGYYFARAGKWLFLGRDFDAAMRAYRRMTASPTAGVPQPLGSISAAIPRGVFELHGSLYRLRNGVWKRLGPSLTTLGALATVQLQLPIEQRVLLAHALNVVNNARRNAKGRRRLAFEITYADAFDMLVASRWCCAVTGTPLSLEVVGGKRPYAPSIDRIDNSKGYIARNCRVVCMAANYAMNVWGEEVLHRMLESIANRQVTLAA